MEWNGKKGCNRFYESLIKSKNISCCSQATPALLRNLWNKKAFVKKASNWTLSNSQSWHGFLETGSETIFHQNACSSNRFGKWFEIFLGKQEKAQK